MLRVTVGEWDREVNRALEKLDRLPLDDFLAAALILAVIAFIHRYARISLHIIISRGDSRKTRAIAFSAFVWPVTRVGCSRISGFDTASRFTDASRDVRSR